MAQVEEVEEVDAEAKGVEQEERADGEEGALQATDADEG